MPIMYSIDVDLGLTLVRWHGMVTAEEFLAHTHKLSTDSHWPPSKYLHLADLRTATLHESVNQDILLKIAEMYSVHPKVRRFKVGIVVTAEAFYKAEAFQRLVQTYMSVIVFFSLSTACDWLNISQENADRTLDSLVPY
ncbi:MAG: hypothetical protein HXY51_15535 [Nitrospirae bacterium]|nr:hypothetical protein [Nitrospirota bacterium]